MHNDPALGDPVVVNRSVHVLPPGNASLTCSPTASAVLVFQFQVMLAVAPNRLLDEVGGFAGPDERHGVVVPVLDVFPDVPDERLHRVKGTPANGLPSQDK